MKRIAAAAASRFGRRWPDTLPPTPHAADDLTPCRATGARAGADPCTRPHGHEGDHRGLSRSGPVVVVRWGAAAAPGPSSETARRSQ